MLNCEIFSFDGKIGRKLPNRETPDEIERLDGPVAHRFCSILNLPVALMLQYF